MLKIKNKIIKRILIVIIFMLFLTINNRAIAINKQDIPQEKLGNSSTTNAIDFGNISIVQIGTKVNEFISKLNLQEEYIVTNIKDEHLSGEDLLGTGTIIQIGEKGHLIVVPGDTNGDGRITITDVSQIKLHYIGLELLDEVGQLGADTNRDGSISITDVSQIKLHYIDLEEIDLDRDKKIMKVESRISKTEIEIGEAIQIETTIEPIDAINKVLEWTSGNETIATVDSSGVIRGMSEGETTITGITTDGSNIEISLTINIKQLKTEEPSLEVPLEEIKLDKVNITLDMSGTKESSLTATKIPTDANQYTGITWTSSNTAVATVDSNGIVTGKANGLCQITAKTENGKTATCNITVQTSPTGITLSKTSLTLDMSGTKESNLTTTISPSTANVKNRVTWTSSNTAVATVDSNGKVTGKANGSCKITAKTENGKEATCNVTIETSPTGITLNKTSLTLDMSGTKESNLTTTISPSIANVKNRVTWTSSNTAVATVDSNGKVIGKANGVCQITAKTENGKTATCNITVQTSPTKITIDTKNFLSADNNTPKLGLKEDKLLIATISPSTANVNTKITWTSSNTGMATVDNSGKVTGIKRGDATKAVTIKAKTANGIEATTEIEIVNKEKAEVTITSTNKDGVAEDNVIKAGDKVTYTLKLKGNEIASNYKNKIHVTDSHKGINPATQKTVVEYDDGTLDNGATVTIGDYNKNTREIKVIVQTKDTMNSVGHLNLVIDAGLMTNWTGKDNSAAVYRYDYVASLNTTKNTGQIGTVVGVANSFYVANYDFYLDNAKKTSNKTTNEYIYTGLENGKEYNIKVNVDFYKEKYGSDDRVSGFIEGKVKTGENKGVEVYFLDASQDPSESGHKYAADAIFIRTAKGKTILIDCGAPAGSVGRPDGAAIIDKFFKNNTSLIKDKKIDYFIGTHIDSDHVGGFEGLIQKGYSFGNIIYSCVNIEKKGDNQNEYGKNPYDYGIKNKNLISATAGNCLVIDNCLLNIFNPYPLADIPTKWISAVNSSNKGIRQSAFLISVDGKNTLSEEVTGYFQTRQTYMNNVSIVAKLICGSRKMLLTGDAEFFVEEMLTGCVYNEMTSGTAKTTFTMPSGVIKSTISDRKPEANIGKKVTITKSATYGYLDDKKGLIVNFSNGTKNNHSVVVGTYLNLVKDILASDDSLKTIADVEKQYKLSRLTEKDITAQVLKKGHHNVKNTTSQMFLNKINPNKIVVTGPAKHTKSLINSLDASMEYRIIEYYKSKPSGLSSSSKTAFQKVVDDKVGNKKYGLQEHLHGAYYNANWFASVFSPSRLKSIVIKTENGTAWSYTGIANRIHDMFYSDCNTKMNK